MPHILWNPKFHYRIHNSPTPVPVLSQINPVHVSASHGFKILFNITLPSIPDLPSGSFLQISPPKPCMHPSLTRATCSAHLIPFDWITIMITGEQYRSLSSLLYSLLHNPVISSLLGRNILLSTLFSSSLTAYVPPSLWERPSFTPTQINRQTLLLYISTFKLLGSKLQDREFCTEW